MTFLSDDKNVEVNDSFEEIIENYQQDPASEVLITVGIHTVNKVMNDLLSLWAILPVYCVP